MNENYLLEFERWTAGPRRRREALSAEFAEHMNEAEAAGDLGSTLERLGPPRDAAKAFAAGHSLRPAPLGRRITAALIDFAIPVLVLLAVSAAAALILAGDPGRVLAEFGSDVAAEREPEWGDAVQAVAAFTAVMGLMWWVAGLTVMEWRVGRGPGKAMMGLRVVTEEGIAPTFGQVVIRRLTLVFSGPLQLIDWAFALFDPRGQRAVEKLAHTMVVQDDATHPRSAAGVPRVGASNVV
ncbi:MAG: RDD family protein [Actinomycetota bacterium]